MTFVVSDACIKCKHTDCVEVCPVDCFYEGPNFLVINPDECIDCALCEPECPVDAIFSEDELPEDEQEFRELNQELSQIWPNITEKKDSLPDAEEWAKVAEEDPLVPTTLSPLGPDVTARLMRHGYANAMANSCVILDYPMRDPPPLERFLELTR